MTDNNGVIISRGNSTTELFTVLCLKISLSSHKNIRRRIKLQELCRPLLGQMIWYNEQRLIAKSQSLGLHSSRHHFKSFACSDCVCKERISAVKNVCNRIFLMFSQFNFRVHTVENNVASIILTRTDTVEFFVIHLRQFFSAGRVSPYPVLKALFYKFLLCLCDCRFFFVENGFLFAFLIFDIIKDTDIFQVQGFLKNFIGIDTGSTVCAVCFHIGTVVALALNIPLSGKL